VSDQNDPLEGAAVGETRTWEHQVTVDTVEMLPREAFGGDRELQRAEVADVEVVPADHPEDPDDVRIRYEVETTKHLPPRWDRCNEPLTAAEQKRERARTWGRRIGRAMPVLVVLMVSTAFSVALTNELTQSLTINGEPVGGQGPAAIAPAVLLVGIAAAIVFALPYLPRRIH